MSDLILCSSHTSFELIVFLFTVSKQSVPPDHSTGTCFCLPRVYLINKTNIAEVHPCSPPYLWFMCAVVFIVTFIETKDICAWMSPFMSSFPSQYCYLSRSSPEISLICFQDWPTASRSTKTAGPTLSTALVQSSTKKCKTCCICRQRLFGCSNDWQHIDCATCCLTAAHRPNEVSGNQLFPKFPSWR